VGGRKAVIPFVTNFSFLTYNRMLNFRALHYEIDVENQAVDFKGLDRIAPSNYEGS